MSPLGALCCSLGCNALLRSASLLVPRAARAEWLSEWRSELWYARQSHAQAPRNPSWRLLRFCLGSFGDAWFLCTGQAEPRPPLTCTKGSAQQCAMLLVGVLALSVLVGVALPNVRVHLWPSHASQAQRLVLIEEPSAAEHGHHTLAAAQYLVWSGFRQHIFQSFLFYRVRDATLSAGESTPVTIRLATATDNAFSTLGLPLQQPVSSSSMQRGIVLSAALWRTRFHADTALIGHTARLNGTEYTVEAIAPQVASQLPGQPEAWITIGSRGLRPHQDGYVIARVSPAFHDASWGNQWRMTAPLPDGSSGDFDCISLSQALRQPSDIFIFAVFLALLALPATTSLPLGEYHSGPRPAALSARLRRWLFLLAKAVLVLAIVYCTSLDVAYAHTHTASNTCDTLQLVSCFCLCLWGLRWTLRDQRQRCPVCLGKLTHPARVGYPSRNFLAWNGTELICAGGHGLLHVPALPTSWFSTQRWLYLDASWKGLFSDQGLLSDTYF